MRPPVIGAAEALGLWLLVVDFRQASAFAGKYRGREGERAGRQMLHDAGQRIEIAGHTPLAKLLRAERTALQSLHAVMGDSKGLAIPELLDGALVRVQEVRAEVAAYLAELG